MHVCVYKVCYVLDAFLTPYVLLSVADTPASADTAGDADSDSARCIVMSLFLHYFFLAQSTAVIVQVTSFIYQQQVAEACRFWVVHLSVHWLSINTYIVRGSFHK